MLTLDYAQAGFESVMGAAAEILTRFARGRYMAKILIFAQGLWVCATAFVADSSGTSIA